MKYIANIITSAKVEPFSDFINVTSDPSFCDYSLPTLIVGWEETKRRFPDANILEKRINDTVFWTFAPRERRSDFERDYEMFKTFTIKQCVKGIKYKYFNFMTSKCEDCKKVLRFVKKHQSIFFVAQDMVYMLYRDSVIGFSLRDAEYIGVKKEKVLQYIKGNHIIYNNNFLSERDKKTFFGNNIIVPYLYSLTVI